MDGFVFVRKKIEETHKRISHLNPHVFFFRVAGAVSIQEIRTLLEAHSRRVEKAADRVELAAVCLAVLAAARFLPYVL